MVDTKPTKVEDWKGPMEAGVERPGVEESTDQDPELGRDEGPVGGGRKVGDTSLRPLVHRREHLDRGCCPLAGRTLCDC